MHESKNFIGSLYLEKYKIIKMLSDKGMNSKVFLAQNTHYKHEEGNHAKFEYVALKFVEKKSQTSLHNWIKSLDEQITLARLQSNPYVVEIELYFPANVNSDVIVFSMEYVDGPNLKTLIKTKGGLPISEALSILQKIVYGLAYMQNQKQMIIHRDLKPENILLSKNLIEVKITDFGIASIIQNTNEGEYDVLSNENEIFGTIPYVCPDIIDYKHKKIIINKQFDFHALGVIFYEMLVGEKPFYCENENDIQNLYYFQKYDLLPLKKINPKINYNIENIICKLLAAKKEHFKWRYQNCQELLADIATAQKVYLNQTQEAALLLPYQKRNYQHETINLITKTPTKLKYFLILNAALLVLFLILFLFLLFNKHAS